MRILLAGGGTAGHVNPLLATAAVLRADGAEVVALGTAEGLEADLVPAAGIELITIPKVPFPRRPSADALRFPGRWRQAMATTRTAIAGADVVAGFGGYVATPAYLAARRADIPYVIHEQNAHPGLANRLGARHAHTVALTFPGTPLRGARVETVGLPLRPAIQDLITTREAAPAESRADGARALGLDPDRPIMVITGGSLGALRLNETLTAAAPDVLDTGAQVLHLTGRGKDAPVRAGVDHPDYHVLDYLPEMEYALACADLVICRAGAGTVSELSALGIPAIYVPLPVGNGEQRRNAADVVASGGGILVDDAEFTRDWLQTHAVPLLRDPQVLAIMAQRAAASGVRDGAQRLATIIRAAVRP